MNKACIPRVLIAAPQGRSGKTTVTLGLIAALRARGHKVQSFKKGPDFIDPSWLSRVSGRPCRNLDAFFMDRETLRFSLAKGSCGADVAVIEGAMGLFDGMDLAGSGSTAEIAKGVESPVLLVVNAVRMTRSIAAIVLGCQHFDPEVQICGVILNNVARPRHEGMLRAAVESFCGIPVVGALPKNKAWEIPDRHLGLVPVGEDERLLSAIDAARVGAEKYIDIDVVLDIARSAPPLGIADAISKRLVVGCEVGVKRGEVNEFNDKRNEHGIIELEGSDGGGRTGLGGSRWKAVCTSKSRVRVGVLQDRAFSFYYPENLEALEAAGASLVFIDALHHSFPMVEALYIGGGFPEVFASELEANVALRDAVRVEIEAGLPVYAECGGLMYLSRALTFNNNKYAMVGALPFDVEMGSEPRGHGYMQLRVQEGNPYFTVGKQIRGHEFHHSVVCNLSDDIRYGFAVERGYGLNGLVDGVIYKNTLAAYCHIHAYAVPEWAPTLVAKGLSYRHSKEARLCEVRGKRVEPGCVKTSGVQLPSPV